MLTSIKYAAQVRYFDVKDKWNTRHVSYAKHGLDQKLICPEDRRNFVFERASKFEEGI